jgi:Cu(I)/Ag(I) efflux system membrane fusion protein
MRKRNIVLFVCAALLLASFFYFSKTQIVPTHKKSFASPAKSEDKISPPLSGDKGEISQGVEIPADKQQLIGVRKVEVALKPLLKTIRTVGRIEYDERKLVTVNIKVEGWIEKLFVDYTGKPVKKGDPLAEIFSPELLATKLEYLNLLNWRKERAHRFQREVEFSWGDRYGTTGRMLTVDIDQLIQVAQQRMKLWDIPEEQIKEIETRNEARRTFILYSPIEGYVLEKPAVQGKRFEPGEKLFDIADLSEVWVIADLYVSELAPIKTGQPARIGLSHFPGREFSSKIDYIYPLLASETRTAKVRFIVPNSEKLLKPQMFTNVEIEIDLGKKLVIPEDAFIDTGSKQVVYVEKGEGYFQPKEVELGLRADGMAEVLRGLKAGERVAVSANFMIDSEAKLKGIAQ